MSPAVSGLRTFLALPLPDVVTDEALQRLAPVREQWPDLRWIPPERWHLTLVFLGDVDEPTLGRLRERVDRVSHRYGPIRLRLESAGRFDDQVLWLGVGGERAPLQRLAASLGAAAERVGIPREARRFRPHLTVARSRGSLRLAPVVDGLRDTAGPWFEAARVTMFASTLGAQVEHQALASWPLTSPEAPAEPPVVLPPVPGAT